MPIGVDPDEQKPDTGASPDRDRLLGLIRRAFADAKASGKEDWHLMYAGVLKNRILILTNRTFDESEWGASGFTALLGFFPEVLRVHRTGKQPPIVELLDREQLEERLIDPVPGSDPIPEHPAIEQPPTDPRRWRIRKDLWDAVLGVRDSAAFVWENGTAARVPNDDASRHDGPRLPTVTGLELDTWRSEFAAEQSPESRYASVLNSWVRNDTPTEGLPRQLQHLWFGHLKSRVRDRLESWFTEQKVAVPDDLIEVPRSVHLRQAGDAATPLRALVIACVQVMTEDELNALSLPAAAVLRAQR
jgi:hypothetical protein